MLPCIGSISGQLPARSGGSSVHGIEVSVLAQWASLRHFGVDAPSHTAPFEHDARGLPGQGVEDAALPVLMAEVCSPARVVRAGLRGLAAPLESVQGFAMAPL